jgi:hypothetical protein
MPRAASLMDDLTRAVLRHIDPRELVDLASALIRIPSFKTEETPVALFLDEFFVSEMVKVTRVLAVTALDVCRREPAELRSTASRRV